MCIFLENIVVLIAHSINEEIKKKKKLLNLYTSIFHCNKKTNAISQSHVFFYTRNFLINFLLNSTHKIEKQKKSQLKKKNCETFTRK